MKNITEQMILEVEKRVKEDKIYGAEERLIDTFFKAHPANTDSTIVAAKVAIIDTTNTTNIARYKSKISLCDVAQTIVNIIDFDKRVREGDVTLVEQIARSTKENHDINLFSFASKYCCYHNVHVYGKDDYSIFDSVVKEHLSQYCNEDAKITTNRIESWRVKIEYAKFNAAIGEVLDSNEIALPNRRRAFDHFLWFTYRNKQ